MLTMPEMTILPNRFVPVREDSAGVYYEAVARFQPEIIGGRNNNAKGGLYLEKAHPEKVWAYVGDARAESFSPSALPLLPADAQKLKVGRPVL